MTALLPWIRRQYQGNAWSPTLPIILGSVEQISFRVVHVSLQRQTFHHGASCPWCFHYLNTLEFGQDIYGHDGDICWMSLLEMGWFALCMALIFFPDAVPGIVIACQDASAVT